VLVQQIGWYINRIMGGNCKGLYIAEKEKKLQRLKPFGRL